MMVLALFDNQPLQPDADPIEFGSATTPSVSTGEALSPWDACAEFFGESGPFDSDEPPFIETPEDLELEAPFPFAPFFPVPANALAAGLSDKRPASSADSAAAASSFSLLLNFFLSRQRLLTTST